MSVNLWAHVHCESDDEFKPEVTTWTAPISPDKKPYHTLKISELIIFLSPAQLAKLTKVIRKAVAEHQASEAA